MRGQNKTATVGTLKDKQKCLKDLQSQVKFVNRPLEIVVTLDSVAFKT